MGATDGRTLRPLLAHTVGSAMPYRANRPLHILLCAPVTVLAAGVLALYAPAHAQAAASLRPVVVVLDSGHGGSPDNSDPSKPYDSGAVSTTGELEKEIALDVARRTAALLAADDVVVVLTRDSDVYMDIPSRTQVAIDHHADVFVSIHMNGFPDPAANGSVTLYPAADDLGFASTMAAAMDRALSAFGVTSRGTMLRDNWWIHVPCPVVTVEPLFLSNPVEGQLIARSDVRDALAGALRDGIEAQDPDIRARRAALEAYRSAHGGSLPAVPVSAPSGVTVSNPARSDAHADPGVAHASASAGAPNKPPVVSGAGGDAPLPMPWRPLVAVAVAAGLWLGRRHLLGVLAAASAGLLDLVAGLDGREAPMVVDRFTWHRQRSARRRRLRARSRTTRRRVGTIYGELYD